MKRRILSFICSFVMVITLMPQMQIVPYDVMADATTVVVPEYKIQDGNDEISWENIEGGCCYRKQL